MSNAKSSRETAENWVALEEFSNTKAAQDLVRSRLTVTDGIQDGLNSRRGERGWSSQHWRRAVTQIIIQKPYR